MVTVYNYKVYDINRDVERPSKKYATEECIRKIDGAVVLYETMMEVAEEQLDSEGRLKDFECRGA